MIVLAQQMIARGELGQIISFQGEFSEDFMADPASRGALRSGACAGGALADLGSHLLSMARYLVGEVTMCVPIPRPYTASAPPPPAARPQNHCRG